eukprot:NODE_3796_length_914_cov_48.247399_g3491_i0.p1 GENE.NODE_3796_length_914_cov_48.247399_g3491_i0~~NODE_3796_length_914_cov_48.247399_g3491_i0.p1  ORF type:complete len:136 (-),score=29.18 NODE_3796_length_914_cov_48.247399_g3491_i0:338-745(-)
MRNESSFWDSTAEFALENYVRGEDGKGKVLARAHVESSEPEFSKFKTEIEDSDNEGWSDDGEEETEYKVKMKWKLRREADFFSGSGDKLGELKVKMKGKSKAEIEVTTDEEGNERRETSTKTDVKKVYYKLKMIG